MKTEIPEDFEITDEMRKWALEKVPQVDIDRETEKFVDYWLAHGKRMANWTATWRNWMRRAPEMGGCLKQARQRNTMTIVDEATKFKDAEKAWREMERLAGKPLRLVK